MRDWQFTGWATLARELTAWFIGPLFIWFLGGPRVRGREHLRGLERPFLVCPTHASHVDVSAVRLALRSRHRWRLAPAAAADYFRASPVRWFFAAWLGAFPFNRSGRGGHESLDRIQAMLRDGWNVLVFPEGTRSRTGEVGAFHAGIGLVAVRSRAQVLPVRIVGSHRVLAPGARIPRRVPVEIIFGPPLRAHDGEDARTFTARLEAAVRALGQATERSPVPSPDPVYGATGVAVSSRRD